jgi:Tol biopolymer transport system component
MLSKSMLLGFTLASGTTLIAAACAIANANDAVIPQAAAASVALPESQLRSDRASRSLALPEACTVKELKKSEIQGQMVYSPDGSRFLANKEDDKGTAQIYTGTTGSSVLTCITCVQRPGGPKQQRFKMQPHWHPSGKWIFLAVERDEYSPPPVLGWSRKYVEGQLQNGLWTNMYVVSPDGLQWHRMTDFKTGPAGTPNGFTGPALTHDGKRAVWSQPVNGNIFQYWPFGRWELILADLVDTNGRPEFSNLRNITPDGMHWNEPGDFAPDNVSLLLSGSVEKDAQGMDQYVLHVTTSDLRNLTRSPTVWDEHGKFSPDGERIIFMSAYPYRADAKSSKVLTIKTEFMLMNKDGSGLTQLTHFREPGYPEYSKKGGIAASFAWSHDGRSANLARLFFPDYEYWTVVFEGPCGKRAEAR